VTDHPGGRPRDEDLPAGALANPLDPALVSGREDLAVEILPATPSTNAALAERARAGAAEGTVVVTEHQTAGRGRLDRTWETPAGTALTFSLLLRPKVPPAAWPWLPLLVGYAVADCLAAADFPARLKWPNDVLIGDRKVAGILVERVESEHGAAAVVGVGLNVLTTAEQLPVQTATSLLLESTGLGHEVPDRSVLLMGLLSSVKGAYDRWQQGGAAAAARLREAYRAACSTVDRDVSVWLPDGSTLVGRAVDVDEHGRLLVAPAAGTPVAVGAGDVVHVRPA
jgi:BirA family biotin operon repressor/biotin-[acetyl-CoA-carboxylase] ligase